MHLLSNIELMQKLWHIVTSTCQEEPCMNEGNTEKENNG
jgi:hypothetical protein